MTHTVKIALADADNAQLRYYAETRVGLEVPRLTNAAQLRAKIAQAVPTLTHIDVPESMAKVIPVSANPEIVSSAPVAPSRKLTEHWSDDPKVALRINSTADKARAKDVLLNVNGEVLQIKRGADVAIPYRFYEALENAQEDVPRDTDEMNPQTGLPIKEWVREHSYPFQVLRMPSDEAVAAWLERTAGARPAIDAIPA